MMVEVTLPTALRRLFPGSPGRLTVEAASVAEVIARLDAEWPGMRDRLVEAGPAIRQHLNIFVDGDRARLDTPLRPGARVQIFTAMSGG